MKEVFKDKWVQCIGVCTISILGALLLMYSDIQIFKAQGVDMASVNIPFLYISTAVQIFIITLIAWLVGTKLMTAVNLKLVNKLEKKEILKVAGIGVLIGAVMLLLDKFLFSNLLEGAGVIKVGLIPSIAYIIYNGFIEEVIFRLGLYTLFTYIFYRLVYKKQQSKIGQAQKVALIFVTLLLLILQIPTIQAMYSLSFIVILRFLILYTLPTIVFTLIYMKKGFNYALISHLSMQIVSYAVFVPILSVI